MFATGRTSPIIGWLRALAAQAHEECGGPGRRRGRDVLHRRLRARHDGRRADARAGAEPAVAAVRAHRRGSAAAVGRQRRPTWPGSRSARPTAPACSGCASPRTGRCRPARFETLRRELGDAFVAVEIDSSPGNPHGIPTDAHSVLTEHLVDEPGHPTRDALDQVLTLFRDRLLA